MRIIRHKGRNYTLDEWREYKKKRADKVRELRKLAGKDERIDYNEKFWKLVRRARQSRELFRGLEDAVIGIERYK